MSAPSPQSRGSIDQDERTQEPSTRSAAYFLNDKPIDIKERRPTVRAIVEAAGFSNPDAYDVFRLSHKDDPMGQPIGLDERIQATPQHPVYLRCEEKGKRAVLGIAPGAVTTPESDASRPLGITDIENLQPNRPRDHATDPPPGPRP